MNISMKEVKKHKKPHNAWVVIHNNVYDVSRFMDEHPGGTQPLLENAGKDGTRAFEDAGHSEDARQIMKKYKIGTLPSKEAVQYGSTIWHSSKKGETSRPRVEKSVTTIIVPIETRSGSATPPSIKKGQSSRVEKRVSTIIVPLEKGSGFPWKYLLLLAAAAGGAFAAYKYLNKAA